MNDIRTSMLSTFSEIYVSTPDKPTTSKAPSFDTLARHTANEILARNHVGRIAFTFHDRVDIEPVHYVYDTGWLYGRTSQGTKLSTIAHHQWVAFEVDEVKSLFDWNSVVVKGSFEIIPADLSPPHAPAYTRAVELLRTLAPDALTPDDRVPFRDILFRIHLDDVTGREARPTAIA